MTSDMEPALRVSTWLKQNPDSVGRALTSMDAIRALPHPGLAPLSVALRTLRGAIRSGLATVRPSASRATRRASGPASRSNAAKNRPCGSSTRA